MPSLRSTPGLALIALAAIVGGLSSAGRASACEMPARRGCSTAEACGCCKPSTPARSVDPVASTSRVSVGVGTLGAVPDGGCACEASRPEAPEPAPAPARTTAGQDGHARGFFPDLPGGSPPSPARPIRKLFPTAGPPSRTPVYLRTSRLLI